MDSNSLNRATDKPQKNTIISVGLILFISLFSLITIIYCFAYLKLNLFTSRIDKIFIQLTAKDWLFILSATSCTLILISFSYLCFLRWNIKQGIYKEAEYPKYDHQNNHLFASQKENDSTQFGIKNIKTVEQIKFHLVNQYGYFWRKKVKIYCVIGQQEEIHHQLPNLIQDGWQEGNRVLLIWGGEPLCQLEQGTKSLLNKLHHKFFDAVIWFASIEFLKQPDFVNKVAINLSKRELSLKWRAPLYSVAIYDQDNAFQETTDNTVGLLLPKQASMDLMLAQFDLLISKLTTQGMRITLPGRSSINQFSLNQSLINSFSNIRFPKNTQIQPDGWLAIANLLALDDAEALSRAFSCFFQHKNQVYFRGMLFTVRLKENQFTLKNTDTHTALATPATPLFINIDKGTNEHSWILNLTWQGIFETTQDDASSVSRDWVYASQLSFTLLLLGLGVGASLSYALNRQMVTAIETRTQMLIGAENNTQEQHNAILTLQQDIERLEHQLTTGLPPFYRFGLSQHQAILNRLWTHYEYSVIPFLQDHIIESLFEILRAWLVLPPNSAERFNQHQASYDALKAYLMLTNPSKTDTLFLYEYLKNKIIKLPVSNDFLPQQLDDKLLRFFIKHLQNKPFWAVERDDDFVTNVRAVLFSQMRISQNETKIYQTILRNASNIYGELSLNEIFSHTDYNLLFNLQIQDGESNAISGIFTRQAYEQEIKNAIKQAVDSRKEQIDWVLTDYPTNLSSTDSYLKDIQQEDTPEALSTRLTERYFNDYSNAWLKFLNRLRWQNPRNLSESIEQLALLADQRQSPLIALFNTISFHSEWITETRELIDSHLGKNPNIFISEEQNSSISSEELTHSRNLLFQKSRDQNAIFQSNLVRNDLVRNNVIRNNQVQKNMITTFGPLLDLLPITNPNPSEHNLFSLQAYITRMTKLRLKLQQAINSPNSELMLRNLVQSTFQGTSVELKDIHDYGQLIAESLGLQWSEFGNTLFVKPLEQVFEQLLIPASESLNRLWQQTIVNEWQRAFQGRFPFTNTAIEASLPLLGQFIRPDVGRIDQFLNYQLAGVIQKQGNFWVPNVLNLQGITFHPEFFDAINQLSDIAQIIYLTGNASIQFELLARPRKGVAATQLLLDGQWLHHFNQVEQWQPLVWPGNLLTTGTRLNWSREKGGMQIFAEHSGSWGFIRLLQQAKVKPLNSNSYQLLFNQKNGPSLEYILQSSLGTGPLALLSLQDFKLPQHIFLTSSDTNLSDFKLANDDIDTDSDSELNLTFYNYDHTPQFFQDNVINIDVENDDISNITKNLVRTENIKDIHNVGNLTSLENSENTGSKNRLDESGILELKGEQSLFEESSQTDIEAVSNSSIHNFNRQSSNRIRNKLFRGFTHQ